MKKVLFLGGLVLSLGFLTNGVEGLNLELADALKLPAGYYFRSAPFQPERFNGPCAGAECEPTNFVLNHPVTGLK